MTLHEEVDASGGGGRWVGPACHVPDIVHSTVSIVPTHARAQCTVWSRVLTRG